ncbi:MAG: DUF4055 domain-containing protein [Planctomycetota bacterium]
MTDFPTHPVIAQQLEAWELPGILMEGTRALREAARSPSSTVDVLPREPGERAKDYTIRLNRSTNIPAFEVTVSDRAERPFVNPMTIASEERMDPRVAELIRDVDLEGRSLTDFARELSRDGHAFGLGMFLVEWSKALRRPYLRHLRPGDLFDFEQDEETNRITMIRFRRSRFARNGKGAAVQEQLVYEYVDPSARSDEPGEGAAVGYTIYSEQIPSSGRGRPKTVVEDQGELRSDGGNPITEIPLIVVYVNRKGVFEADPPLRDLADLNLRFFQAYSDLSNFMRFSNIPRLKRTGMAPRGSSGFQKEATAANRIHAVNSIMDLPKDADAEWLEPRGAAAEISMEDLRNLREWMSDAGANIQIRTSSVQTATATIRSEMKQSGGMVSFVRSLETALTKALELKHTWFDAPFSESIAAQVNEERVVAPGDERQADVVLRARKDRVISNPTAVQELKHLAYISDNVDPQQESAAVRREGALVGMLDDLGDEGDEFGEGVPGVREGDDE